MNDLNSKNPSITEDEIDLRELFSTIGRYKWSIMFFTLLITIAVVAKVYLMPKYYKSTVTIEVKPQEDKSSGFSMGAAAMFLGGGGGSTSLDKDVTLLKMYAINSKVLDRFNGYRVRYFIKDDKYKEHEVDSNLSIEVTNIKIKNFKDYGMRLMIKPLSKTEYKLFIPGRFKDKLLGTFHYSEMVNQEKFTFMINKKNSFTTTYTIQLSGEKRYVYNQIIVPNLTIEADKTSPFITLSFLDNLPHRGESYLKNLVEIYTKQSIKDIKEDSSVMIRSYDKQLQKIENRVDSSAKKLEEYKSQEGIIQAGVQAGVLVGELSKVEIEIAQNRYKEELVSGVIALLERDQNVDTITPTLIELGDNPTIELIGLIQEQEIKLGDLLIKYNSSHPTIVKLYQLIDTLKAKVFSNIHGLERAIQAKAISLTNMKARYNEKLQSAPKQEQKIIKLSRNYQVNEKIYLYLLQKRSAEQLKYDKTLSRFKIIEDFYTADKAVKPKKALIVIVAFITSLILMIFIAFFREFMRNNKKERRQFDSFRRAT
jgi:uncharacterized protein involved in exopolysaccharide biosynthesis